MNFEEWWIELQINLVKLKKEEVIFRGQVDKEWELKTSF